MTPTQRTRARWLRQYHLAMTGLWMLMVPVSILTGIWESVRFVTFLSIWALVATEWGAWQASRAETAQDTTTHDG